MVVLAVEAERGVEGIVVSDEEGGVSEGLVGAGGAYFVEFAVEGVVELEEHGWV